MERYIFYLVAFLTIVSAVAAVSGQKMLRSVVYLLFALIGMAGIYFLIDYNFLAAVQLTVYAGGIVVLIIFSVLLIHHIEMKLEMANTRIRILAALVCVAGLVLVLGGIWNYPFETIDKHLTTTTASIGRGLLNYGEGGFILPFELISVLLLASMIGAIIIAKGNKPAAGPSEQDPNPKNDES